ncbi:N-acetyltransferase family protein [Streptomyces cadmiisoli]|uniref:GNAT family N-acetyltransferase n=1 Tax=Streptomyces cadmiisoli TaxID=2184053 RepID=UPI003D766499
MKSSAAHSAPAQVLADRGLPDQACSSQATGSRGAWSAADYGLVSTLGGLGEGGPWAARVIDVCLRVEGCQTDVVGLVCLELSEMPQPLPAPVLRPALEEDLAVLEELARRTIDARYRSFLGDEGVDWFINSGASDDHIESHFRKGHLHCMEVSGDLVGLLITDESTIDLLMIDVDRQRQGLGRLLLSQAEQLLFAEYQAIRLETFATNATAVAFYEACGWSQSGQLESDGPVRIEFRRRRGM